MQGISAFMRDEFGGYERMWAEADAHRYHRHSHDEFSVIVVTEGKKLFRVGRETHEVRAGEVVVVAPGDSHECEAIGGEDWAHVCWYVQPKFVSGLMQDRAFMTAPPLCSGVISDPSLSAGLIQVHRGAQQTPDDLLLHEIDALNTVFNAAKSKGAPRPTRGESARQYRSALYEEAMREEYSEAIDLEKLSRIGNVSVYQVMRDLKATRGLSPGRLLKDLRLRKSKIALRDGADIAQVSLDLGFADQAHFSRAFKAAYGVSPVRYKKGVGV